MQFLRKAWLQTKALGETLTPSQKWLIGLVVIVMGLLVLVILPYVGGSSMVPISQFAPERQPEVLQRLAVHDIKAEVKAGQVWVASDRQMEAIAVLQQAELTTVDTSAAFNQLITQQSPWMSDGQNKQAYMLALRKTLGLIVASFNGVKSADVFLSTPEDKGFGATYIRPSASVSVTMESGKSVNHKLTEAIAGLIAGAVAEMQPQDVVVVDANNGQQFTVKGEDEIAPDETLDLLIAQENRYRRKIENVLNYIPGVKIAVNVQASPVLRKDIEEFEYSKTEPLRLQESREQERRNVSDAGEAGARPNAQLSIPGGASSGTMETMSEKRSEFGPLNITRKVAAREVGNTTKQVNVTINIPRSYFRGMLLQGLDTPGQELTAQQIEDAAAKELPRIVAQVEPLINAEAEGVVRAHMIPDPDVLLAMLGGGPKEDTGFITLVQSPLAKPLGLGGLALLSLALMAYMVRKSLQQPPLPSVEELAGVPPPLPTDDDLIGEVAEEDTAMAGVEVGEDEIRSRKIAEQINDMIKANPDEATNLFNRWVQAED